MTRTTLLFSLIPALLLTGCPGDKPADDTGGGEETGADDTGGGDTDSGGGDTDSGGGDTDSGGDTDTGPAAEGIYAIQQGEIAVGETVTLTDVVVTSPNTGYGFFVQEPEGGEYSGLWVYYGDIEDDLLMGPLASVNQGDNLTVTGVVTEYSGDGGAGTLTELAVADGSSASVNGTAATPDPLVVTPETLADPALAEPYESCLVTVESVTVVNPDLEYGEFTIDADVRVDDLFYDTIAELGPLYAGDTFTAIRGPLNFAYGNFKIVPREETDLQGYSSSGASCAAELCVDDLGYGDLVVTEYMANPHACADPNGEYFEIYNATSGSVDLLGLVIWDALDGYEVTESVVLAAGEYAWLANGSSASEFCYADHGTPAFFYASGLALGNDGDAISLYGSDDSADLIDAFAYPGDLTPKGVGVGLNPDLLDADSNDDVANWCQQSTAIGAGGDVGTPGASNDPCSG